MAALSMQDIAGKVGEQLGVTEWTTLDQSRIQAFADCTDDRQWIHVDVERARRESPFGGPVAHGRRDTQPGRLVNSRLRGTGPSLTTTDLPCSSWPVTTLRIRLSVGC